ncbi:hypothetical protein Poli38472_012924 [Pythium oligandrum]|uniref:Transmembrane protein n=1 Tax=Pythium oligandrum TaxID=41045 RepID=A0A8K1CL59_PYTOL|nr:hypothetical protein Poli38472_012924 [Pythium oligandrum]|eukprot:TMW64302.1 hypothetical protein Poli38472_012924 [Pythium oligandrum]
MNTILFILSVLAMPLCWYFVFQTEAHLVATLPAECNQVLDSVFFYEPERVYTHLSCMDQVGRELYRDFYKFDFAFLIMYGVFHYGMLTRLWPEATKFMRVFSLLTSVFDLLENTCTLLVLTKLPEKDETLALGMALFGRTKWFFAALTGVLMTLGLLRLVLTRLWPEAINFVRVFSLLTSVFDLMENTSTLVTQSKFPEKSDTLALFMSTFCQIKWFLAFVTGGVILLGLIRLAFKKLVSSKQIGAKKTN